jgi:hypothetical protein
VEAVKKERKEALNLLGVEEEGFWTSHPEDLRWIKCTEEWGTTNSFSLRLGTGKMVLESSFQTDFRNRR